MEPAKIPNSLPTQPIQYLKCSKQGLHQMENINLVCLQKTCLENLVCCCACIQSDHKKHRTKPLKMVVSQVREQSSTPTQSKINVDIMLDIVKQQQKAAFDLYRKYKGQVIAQLQNIELALQGYYNHTIDQILLKNSDSNLIIEQALLKASAPKNIQDLKITTKKLVAILADKNSNNKDLTEQQLKQSLQQSSQIIHRSIQLSMQEVSGNLTKYKTSVSNLIVNTNLWQVSYKFSPTFKHQNIKVVSNTKVKAINGQGYKFALMEPKIESISKKTFSFAINQLTSNWLAIGFCLQKVVQTKNYSFVFGAIGHGAYMISSNGGSWSHSKAESNNTLKAIKFGKGDTVHATIDYEISKIYFSKNKGNEKYELPFEKSVEDSLHPCVLFYYMNDEVEYLGNTKI